MAKRDILPGSSWTPSTPEEQAGNALLEFMRDRKAQLDLARPRGRGRQGKDAEGADRGSEDSDPSHACRQFLFKGSIPTCVGAKPPAGSRALFPTIVLNSGSASPITSDRDWRFCAALAQTWTSRRTSRLRVGGLGGRRPQVATKVIRMRSEGAEIAGAPDP